MVQYKVYKPQRLLSEYIRFFWSLEVQVNEQDSFVHRALPDNCIELIFYCKGKLAISSLAGDEGNTFASGVFGQAQKFRQFKTNSNFHLFGVYLYPYSIKLLFNLPSYHLCNEKIDSETLWGLQGKMLEEQIMLADTDDQRVVLASNFFLDRIKVVANHYRAFAHRVKSVVDNNSILSIPSFAHDCNLSRRQFERKFNEFSGLSPKDFFKIGRFKNALKAIDQRSKSLAQIAMDAGYYDQSHFNNEFKKFSGYSPKEYAVNYPDEIDTRATRDFKN